MPRFTEQNDHPVVSAINVIINETGQVLLGRRSIEPDNGKWGLIGGRMEMFDNNVEMAALRELKEETGFTAKLINLVTVIGDPYIDPPADPRFYVVQIVFETVLVADEFKVTDEIDEIRWFEIDEAIKKIRAFDHQTILKIYKEKKLAGKLIPLERTHFTDYYGKDFNFIRHDYVHFVVKSLILNENNEILLGRRIQKPEVGYWDLPGGHMTWIEEVHACLKRELREELGVGAEVEELFHIYSDRGQSERFHRVVALYFVKIDSQNFLKNIEMDEFKYFSLDNLPADIAYHYDGALIDLKKYLASKNKI